MSLKMCGIFRVLFTILNSINLNILYKPILFALFTTTTAAANYCLLHKQYNYHLNIIGLFSVQNQQLHTNAICTDCSIYNNYYVLR